jgi:hypothetical protein
MVQFVVYPDEAKQFEDIGANVLIYEGKKGIAYKRQFVIDQSPEEYIYMLDDDCTFSLRKDGRLVSAKRSEVKDMFELLTEWLKRNTFGQVGMSFRGLNFTQPDFDFMECQNVYSVFGFNRYLFAKLGLRCDHCVFLTDMQITLGLLHAGYKNRVTYKYAVHQTPGAKGGCADYRTKENQRHSVETVHKLFPKHTKIIRRPKTDKKENAGWRDYDLKVSWKKAYFDGFALLKRGDMLRRIF